MINITKSATAGTADKNDIAITLEPAETGIEIELESPVYLQFGDAIIKTIEDVIREQEVTGVKIRAIDQGALDYTIRARMLTALSRAGVAVKGVKTL